MKPTSPETVQTFEIFVPKEYTDEKSGQKFVIHTKVVVSEGELNSQLQEAQRVVDDIKSQIALIEK